MSQIPIENSHSNEQSLNLVLLLHVQIEYFLDGVTPIKLRNDVLLLFLSDRVCNLLWETEVLILNSVQILLKLKVILRVEVVEHQLRLFLLPEPEVGSLGEFSMVLATRGLLFNLATVHRGNLTFDVHLIVFRKNTRSLEPPFSHYDRVRWKFTLLLGLDRIIVFRGNLVHNLVLNAGGLGLTRK